MNLDPTNTCQPCGTPAPTREENQKGWLHGGQRWICPECRDGVHRRWVVGSTGEPYVLRFVGGAWRCHCKAYLVRFTCKHAEALPVLGTPLVEKPSVISHTCVLTFTTVDGSIPPPCPACQAESQAKMTPAIAPSGPGEAT